MLCIGLMSGTSLDGIDVALCEIEGSGETLRAQVVHFYSAPYDLEFRGRLLAACTAETAGLESIARLNVEVAERFAAAAMELLEQHRIAMDRIAFLASHGHTLAHWPPSAGARGVSWQLGDAATLAERTGIAVVADFRAADTAAGGQGAPLVPYADWCLLRSNESHRIVQNIGGIANGTWLPRDGDLAAVRAWDNGPGVMVMDALSRALHSESCDFEGALAAQGEVCAPLLQHALAHPYFHRKPPKSCGRAEFGAAFAAQFLADARKLELSDIDILATATALTARAIADDYRAGASVVFGEAAPVEVILGGGGAFNPTLVQMLRDELKDGLEIGGERVAMTLGRHEDHGIRSDAKEALAFAILGAEAWREVPNTVPSATGARRAVVAGSVTRV